MKPVELPGKVGILGLGRSGISAARALVGRPVQVIAADENQISDERKEAIRELEQKGVEVITGPDAFDRVLKRDLPLYVTSPGIGKTHPAIVALMERKTPIWSELELGYHLLPYRPILIAVTGTKGKGTTVMVTEAIFRASGVSVAVGGNLGTPLCDLLSLSPKPSVLVLEVSSFQLAFTASFRPHVAVVTNLYADHLNWHPDLNDYRRSKEKIFSYQKATDWAVLNGDDPGVLPMAAKVRGRILWCGKRVSESCPYCTHWVRTDEEYAWVSLGSTEFAVARWDQFPLRGEHNRYNAMLAIGAALLGGANPTSVGDALQAVAQQPHRLEIVGVIDGVTFVNDSASTVPEATAQALKSFAEPIHLIAGGRGKGGKWEVLKAVLADRVRTVYGIGETGRDVCRVAQTAGVQRSSYLPDLESAFREAVLHARRGEVILLSPGAASHDQFRSYEERGERFRQLVNRLRDGTAIGSGGDEK